MSRRRLFRPPLSMAYIAYEIVSSQSVTPENSGIDPSYPAFSIIILGLFIEVP